MGLYVVLFFACVTVVAGQFGLPVPPVKPPTALGNGGIPAVPLNLDPTGWTKKIQDLLDLIGTTFKNMGQIALKDNEKVGQEIVKILQGELLEAGKILTKYAASVATGGKVKRETNDCGSHAFNKVGGRFVNADKATESQKNQLSEPAQAEYTAEHMKGIMECANRGNDACKNSGEVLEKTEGADDDRQCD